MKPYYDLDNITTRRIFEFIEKCEELKLDNACFIYDSKLTTEVKFYMVKQEDYWELTVIQNWEKKRDIYKVKAQSLAFSYSLKD